MATKNQLLKTYLILIIIFSFIGIITSVFQNEVNRSLLTKIIISILELFMIGFSIYCLIEFIRKKLRKITYVLPIIYISFPIVFFIFGLFIGVIKVAYGYDAMPIFNSDSMKIFFVAENLFEMTFAIYLLRK
jgi:hypothetical protein